jgi:pimeloyl-ACP methyl ester carboxylesterase
MAERMIEVNGAQHCTEPFGDPAERPILLVQGVGASMLWWDEGLCRTLSGAGCFVIRYDYRDTGRSTTYEPGHPGYTGADLLTDAAGVLDAYDIFSAHLVGVSAGGAFAQRLALEFPDRVRSLVLISTRPRRHQLRVSVPAIGTYTLKASGGAGRSQRPVKPDRAGHLTQLISAGASVAEHGGALVDPLPQGRGAAELRTVNQVVFAELARAEADRAHEHAPARARVLGRERRQRWTPIAGDALGDVRECESDRLLGQEHRHLLARLSGRARHEESDRHALGILESGREVDHDLAICCHRY